MTEAARTTARRGFSLVELMVSITVLTLLGVILLGMLWETQRIWTSSTRRTEAFREARAAFESLSRNLSQAALRSYWDYDDANDPTTYVRRSELRFRTGKDLLGGSSPARGLSHAIFFQAPLGGTSSEALRGRGLENLFNSCGYFIEHGDDDAYRPGFLAAEIPARRRFRLMQWIQPTEEWDLFQQTSGNPGYNEEGWFVDHLGAGQPENVHILAENVLALVILPKLPAEEAGPTDLAPDYEYDSAPENWPPSLPQDSTENRLPPLLQVTMVTMDETSGALLDTLSPDPVAFLGLASLFQQADELENDLEILAETLRTNGLQHRVFQSALSLKSAR